MDLVNMSKINVTKLEPFRNVIDTLYLNFRHTDTQRVLFSDFKNFLSPLTWINIRKFYHISNHKAALRNIMDDRTRQRDRIK